MGRRSGRRRARHRRPTPTSRLRRARAPAGPAPRRARAVAVRAAGAAGGSADPDDGAPRTRDRLRGIGIALVILAVVAFFLLAGFVLDLITDAIWFRSVGFDAVFFTRLGTQAGLFIGVLVAVLLFLGLNIWLAGRLAPPPDPERVGQMGELASRLGEALGVEDQRRAGAGRGGRASFAGAGFGPGAGRAIAFEADELPDLVPVARWGLIGIAVIIALATAASAASHWETFLLWRNQVPFAPSGSPVVDPIFGRDVSYYLFELPFLRAVQAAINGLLIAALVLSLGRYLLAGVRGGLVFTTQMRVHLAVLGGLYLLSVAIGYQLDKLELVYSTQGITLTAPVHAVGVSFTDQNARFLAYDVLTVISAFAAAFLVIGAFTRAMWPLAAVIIVWLSASIVLGSIYPGLVQRFSVEPDQLNRETPYIANNINMTRLAFNLDDWESRNYSGEAPLTQAAVEAETATFQNARLWDYRPLKDTLDQLQTVRQYYDFTDVDTDRYDLDGTTRQVMLSARELAPENNPQGGTWVNQRITFTHGIGVAMVPVNAATAAGQPQLIIRDLPPVSIGRSPGDHPAADLLRRAPERLDHHRGPPERVRLPGRHHEHGRRERIRPDHPLDRQLGHPARHDLVPAAVRAPVPRSQPADQRPGHGRQPAPVPSIDLRAAAADRAVPALRQGPVPGRHRRRAPRLHPGRLHDLRPVPERPVVRPGLPAEHRPRRRRLQLHPEQRQDRDGRLHRADDVLRGRRQRSDHPDLRADLPDAVHQARSPCRPSSGPTCASPRSCSTSRRGRSPATTSQDPAAFYNNEDLWTVPANPGGSQSLPNEAYYVEMRMPGEADPEFLLLQPMVPSTRPNMIAWVAARMDDPNYGKVRVYRFPQNTSVLGPIQIEAKIDADPVISAQTTLWNQSGSKVIRGNLIVMPIQDSLIYLQPVYLQSANSAFPEFQRIVVATSQRIVWGPTLKEALTLLLAGGRHRTGPVAEPIAEPRWQPDAGANRRTGRDSGAGRRGRLDRLCERPLRPGPGRAPSRRLRDLRRRDGRGPAGARAPRHAGPGQPGTVTAGSVTAGSLPRAARIVFDAPRLWALGLAGFLARGGIVLFALPIVVLPSVVGLTTFIGPNSVTAAGLAPRFVAIVAITTVVLVGWIVLATLVGGRRRPGHRRRGPASVRSTCDERRTR